jgi:phasin
VSRIWFLQLRSKGIGLALRASRPESLSTRNAPKDASPMNMNSKTTTTKTAGFPDTDAPQAFREIAENGTKQTKETYEKMSAATTDAVDLIKDSYSTAFEGIQDYNNKFIEFAHDNINAAFDFAQKVCAVKSPSAFAEMSTEYARRQFETLTEQTKQLTAFAQKVTLATAEPLKTGVAKSFNRRS